ncbi:MAG: aldehyde oxidase, partial [Candidatus Hydrothermota bacterium]
MKKFSIIGKSIKKIDALSLATGTEKFTADFKVEEPLHLAILYSPYAHAEIISIDISEALGLQGVVDVLYQENTPRVLFTTAGQGFPEPSPYDTYIFDKKVRFVGDKVAAVLAESPEIAREALKKIKVEYKLLKPIFDPENAMAKDAPVIHDDGEHAMIPAKYDPERNLAAEVEFKIGDVEEGLKDADIVLERVYRVQYASHCAIEPHAVVAYFDERGRLVIITTTQVPFHARRIVSRILSIPAGMIRVIKPRIGGGFGGKQEVFLEPLVAYAAWKHKRAIRLVLTRKEVFITGRTRHPMRIKMKTGAKRNGEITAFSMDALMNAGAYGPHALTVMANAGSKVLPLFNKIK